MIDMQPVVSPGTARTPAHPSITPEQISQLVDRFYQRARADDRLGPIFESRLNGEWGAPSGKDESVLAFRPPEDG